ncbi:MAG TPA: glycerophosphodiester phosphodiesterase family protein [Pyrinomonadaceae bacterium]|jgi:glycerophosphoryl diester phosphodiesterase|nr:glycerophosphodiester phosphodiesterase family protein [Pyrinomonadaceae bacterium]
MKGGVKIIAHRGASAHAPENTLTAFRMGIEAGAHGVEFDVRLAKDGVPVVIHDRTLKRLAGRAEAVADLTSVELADVDVGSWFNRRHPKRARPEFTALGVRTLSEVLDLHASANGVIHIELKLDRKKEVTPLVAAVCDAIKDLVLLPRVVISSFKLAAITEAKFVLPALTTSALFAPSIMNVLKRRRHLIAVARAFQADGLSPHRSLVTPKLARLAAEMGMPVTIWTADHPKWLGRCRKLGIGALMTNDPAEMTRAGRVENDLTGG